MHNAFSVIPELIAPLSLAATISNATVAPPAKATEDRYVAARDATIEKISAVYVAAASAGRVGAVASRKQSRARS